MSIEKLQKGCALVLAIYVVLALAFYWVTGDQLHYRDDVTESVSASEPVGELTREVELRQPFAAQGNKLIGVSMQMSTYARMNTAHVLLKLVDGEERTLIHTEFSSETIADNVLYTITFAQPVEVTPGERYTLVLTSPDGEPGNAVTVWKGNTMSAARAQVAVEITDKLLVNGESQDGMLCFSLQTRSNLWFGTYYWYLATALGLLLVGYCVYLCLTVRWGKNCLALRVISAFQRYGYLMRQLVSRDFKTKYKRSVLGVLWSFLNPLLTMMVQYIVFSALFRSDINNFPLYLLTGIVCFNFFNEACGMGLQSIVGNASLITKVYVPKYIYPVSRVFSSTINLLLSLIPLLVVMLLTRMPIRPSILLLPFGLICLVAFCIGMSLILSSLMVFFRDTQFLWGVVSMLWMYATPIFYPESIIPGKYMLLYKCNPLYHIIRFIRIVLMNGISPEPKAYGLCLIVSFVPLLVGAIIFKRNQDKFILNL